MEGPDASEGSPHALDLRMEAESSAFAHAPTLAEEDEGGLKSNPTLDQMDQGGETETAQETPGSPFESDERRLAELERGLEEQQRLVDEARSLLKKKKDAATLARLEDIRNRIQDIQDFRHGDVGERLRLNENLTKLQGRQRILDDKQQELRVSESSLSVNKELAALALQKLERDERLERLRDLSHTVKAQKRHLEILEDRQSRNDQYKYDRIRNAAAGTSVLLPSIEEGATTAVLREARSVACRLDYSREGKKTRNPLDDETEVVARLSAEVRGRLEEEKRGKEAEMSKQLRQLAKMKKGVEMRLREASVRSDRADSVERARSKKREGVEEGNESKRENAREVPAWLTDSALFLKVLKSSEEAEELLEGESEEGERHTDSEAEGEEGRRSPFGLPGPEVLSSLSPFMNLPENPKDKEKKKKVVDTEEETKKEEEEDGEQQQEDEEEKKGEEETQDKPPQAEKQEVLLSRLEQIMKALDKPEDKKKKESQPTASLQLPVTLSRRVVDIADGKASLVAERPSPSSPDYRTFFLRADAHAERPDCIDLPLESAQSARILPTNPETKSFNRKEPELLKDDNFSLGVSSYLNEENEGRGGTSGTLTPLDILSEATLALSSSALLPPPLMTREEPFTCMPAPSVAGSERPPAPADRSDSQRPQIHPFDSLFSRPEGDKGDDLRFSIALSEAVNVPADGTEGGKKKKEEEEEEIDFTRTEGESSEDEDIRDIIERTRKILRGPPGTLSSLREEVKDCEETVWANRVPTPPLSPLERATAAQFSSPLSMKRRGREEDEDGRTETETVIPPVPVLLSARQQRQQDLWIVCAALARDIVEESISAAGVRAENRKQERQEKQHILGLQAFVDEEEGEQEGEKEEERVNAEASTSGLSRRAHRWLSTDSAVRSSVLAFTHMQTGAALVDEIVWEAAEEETQRVAEEVASLFAASRDAVSSQMVRASVYAAEFIKWKEEKEEAAAGKGKKKQAKAAAPKPRLTRAEKAKQKAQASAALDKAKSKEEEEEALYWSGSWSTDPSLQREMREFFEDKEGALGKRGVRAAPALWGWGESKRSVSLETVDNGLEQLTAVRFARDLKMGSKDHGSFSWIVLRGFPSPFADLAATVSGGPSSRKKKKKAIEGVSILPHSPPRKSSVDGQTGVGRGGGGKPLLIDTVCVRRLPTFGTLLSSEKILLDRRTITRKFTNNSTGRSMTRTLSRSKSMGGARKDLLDVTQLPPIRREREMAPSLAKSCVLRLDSSLGTVSCIEAQGAHGFGFAVAAGTTTGRVAVWSLPLRGCIYPEEMSTMTVMKDKETALPSQRAASRLDSKGTELTEGGKPLGSKHFLDFQTAKSLAPSRVRTTAGSALRKQGSILKKQGSILKQPGRSISREDDQEELEKKEDELEALEMRGRPFLCRASSTDEGTQWPRDVPVVSLQFSEDATHLAVLHEEEGARGDGLGMGSREEKGEREGVAVLHEDNGEEDEEPPRLPVSTCMLFSLLSEDAKQSRQGSTAVPLQTSSRTPRKKGPSKSAEEEPLLVPALHMKLAMRPDHFGQRDFDAPPASLGSPRRAGVPGTMRMRSRLSAAYWPSVQRHRPSAVCVFPFGPSQEAAVDRVDWHWGGGRVGEREVRGFRSLVRSLENGGEMDASACSLRDTGFRDSSRLKAAQKDGDLASLNDCLLVGLQSGWVCKMNAQSRLPKTHVPAGGPGGMVGFSVPAGVPERGVRFLGEDTGWERRGAEGGTLDPAEALLRQGMKAETISRIDESKAETKGGRKLRRKRTMKANEEDGEENRERDLFELELLRREAEKTAAVVRVPVLRGGVTRPFVEGCSFPSATLESLPHPFRTTGRDASGFSVHSFASSQGPFGVSGTDALMRSKQLSPTSFGAAASYGVSSSVGNTLAHLLFERKVEDPNEIIPDHLRQTSGPPPNWMKKNSPQARKQQQSTMDTTSIGPTPVVPTLNLNPPTKKLEDDNPPSPSPTSRLRDLLEAEENETPMKRSSSRPNARGIAAPTWQTTAASMSLSSSLHPHKGVSFSRGRTGRNAQNSSVGAGNLNANPSLPGPSDPRIGGGTWIPRRGRAFSERLEIPGVPEREFFRVPPVGTDRGGTFQTTQTGAAGVPDAETGPEVLFVGVVVLPRPHLNWGGRERKDVDGEEIEKEDGDEEPSSLVPQSGAFDVFGRLATRRGGASLAGGMRKGARKSLRADSEGRFFYVVTIDAAGVLSVFPYRPEHRLRSGIFTRSAAVTLDLRDFVLPPPPSHTSLDTLAERGDTNLPRSPETSLDPSSVPSPDALIPHIEDYRDPRLTSCLRLTEPLPKRAALSSFPPGLPLDVDCYSCVQTYPLKLEKRKRRKNREEEPPRIPEVLVTPFQPDDMKMRAGASAQIPLSLPLCHIYKLGDYITAGVTEEALESLVVSSGLKVPRRVMGRVGDLERERGERADDRAFPSSSSGLWRPDPSCVSERDRVLALAEIFCETAKKAEARQKAREEALNRKGKDDGKGKKKKTKRKKTGSISLGETSSDASRLSDEDLEGDHDLPMPIPVVNARNGGKPVTGKLLAVKTNSMKTHVAVMYSAGDCYRWLVCDLVEGQVFPLKISMPMRTRKECFHIWLPTVRANIHDGYNMVNVPQTPVILPRHSGVAVEVVFLEVGFEVGERTTEVLVGALTRNWGQFSRSDGGEAFPHVRTCDLTQSIHSIFPVPCFLGVSLSLPSRFKGGIALLTFHTVTSTPIVFTYLAAFTITAVTAMAAVLTDPLSTAFFAYPSNPTMLANL
uniref:Uncharacterized protein n=1 Tax=Chromera velia CCMP2878 TaxID=1169474 RepID=A0A0G4HKX2_9ALVE|eukprot:Cvel_7351.t1-p1 / transcript=Cvel_7351.t1 / gene=Cvel_7351 / organism=Chromera_velia_CCMP2878 / gene_product=hypothetical protein / transcript_product=hypothetical protein / location=Cvel_scaffold381:63321-76508(-) / protein_length=2760 / sequence_SO=supercontig / SO=protein_coding / is_pseudo=false